MNLLNRFFPNIYIKSIYDLPLEDLKRNSIDTLVFDIDNTICPYDIAEPDDNILDLFLNFKKLGFKICILSNNNRKRIKLFNKNLKVYAVYKAGKPGIKKLKMILKKMNSKVENSAMIGDQIFTDIWCGNRANMYTILTEPICNRDQLITKVKRGLEKRCLNVYFRRNGIEKFKNF